MSEFIRSKEACVLCKEVTSAIRVKFYTKEEWLKSDDFKKFCAPSTNKFKSFSDLGCKGKDKNCSNYILPN